MEGSVIRRIHALRRMTVAELELEWERVFGAPPRTTNQAFLWKRLAWRVQELALGGLSDAAKQRLEELSTDGIGRASTPRVTRVAAAPAPVEKLPRPTRNLRLPTPGTVISRRWRGRELRLLVRDDGYELDGLVYSSFTEAASAVTGSHWNGKLFWGVTQRKRRA